MIRLLVSPDRIEDGASLLTLTADETHYILRVRRLGVGDTLDVRDGCGHQYISVIVSHTTIRLGPPLQLPIEEGFPVELAFAAPKGKRADLLLEKATEIGAIAFRPIQTERSIPRTQRSVERWQRIIRAAARQCSTAMEPVLHPLCPLEELVTGANHELRLLATPYSENSLHSVLPDDAPSSCMVLTGPEGGFTAEELDVAQRAGWRAFSMGDRILRAETAPLVVLSVLRHVYGDAK